MPHSAAPHIWEPGCRAREGLQSEAEINVIQAARRILHILRADKD